MSPFFTLLRYIDIMHNILQITFYIMGILAFAKYLKEHK